MHIEPGVVDGAKMILSYVTATASVGIIARLALKNISKDGISALMIRSMFTTFFVFIFFQILPHHPVGVSEVHFILGSTLFLIFGVGPAAIGLCLGLLIQGALFAPLDLPQYGINITTLLLPLFAMSMLAKKIIPANTAYKDISYSQTLKLSAVFQGGIVAWVSFWAVYGRGFDGENLLQIFSFGAAYMTIILFEPLVDLGVLFVAKKLHSIKGRLLFERRLYEENT